MRSWRVGTYSMGAALISLGLFLFAAQFLKINLSAVMKAWWPVILIILGIELLVFLQMNKKENPPVKYDFLSIIFVIVIGSLGVAFALANTTGIIDKIDYAVNSEQKTLDLPIFDEEVPSVIKRIVVDTAYPLTIESTNELKVSVFGTYQSTVRKLEKLVDKPEEFIQKHINGDTIFIRIKELPVKEQFFQTIGEVTPTILVPGNINLEVNGHQHEIKLKSRTLLSNWEVTNAGNVTVKIKKDENVSVVARDSRIVNSELGWDQIKRLEDFESSDRTSEENEKVLREYNEQEWVVEAVKKIGKGEYTILVLDSESVQIEFGL
ncbi:LiaI-LiaF-like domain-containing protein [Bacillus kwashiorkori]|uniref:LiaI-LiaF-like domain-containing protein n=1 Tax=Bacillus kwashiorkori TaxID=1522318 RepID=UPI0007844EC5|nr:DUF5668 domain-containing protein [Bacillus kwashiorkori]